MPDPGVTFATAPPERIALGEGTALVRCRVDRAAAAVEAINTSLEHLRPWMAWAEEPATEAAMTTLFAASEAQWDQRSDFSYTIVDGPDEAVIGGCGLHARLGPDGLEIGYWVHVDHGGRGLATAASRALTDAAFAIDGIERVRITCAEDNLRSARVPEKLGYEFQGLSVPDDGPCTGRSTQVWVVQRADWIAGSAERAS
jgi:RimJ/RimL family protein N-acetyltransferase